MACGVTKLLKELVIGFLVALGISSYLAGTNGVDPSNGWGLPPTTAGGQGPDLIDEVNAGTFQGEVLDSSIPVLVEFYTQSCVHCQNMKPELAKLSQESQGYLRMYKVDSETNRSLAEKYDVTGTPAFVLFKQGKVVNSTAGEMTKDELAKWVKQELDLPTS